MTMGSILTDIGSIFTQFVTMLGNIASTVVSSPILLLFVVFGLAFAAVGLFKRLTR